MSFIRRQKIQNVQPQLDPNAPPGPTGPTGPSGPAGPTGSTGNNYPVGSTGASCNSGGSVTLPNGNIVTIPYNNGWYYNITIPPAPTKESVKVKPKDGRDGCDCVKCKTFFEFAEPNQEDGTLICWACRHGY